MAGVLVVDRRDSGPADRLVLVGGVRPRLLGQGDEWFTLAGFRDAFAGTLLRGSLNSWQSAWRRRSAPRGRWGSRVADFADQCRWATVVGGGDVRPCLPRLTSLPLVGNACWSRRCLRSDGRTGWRAEAAVLRAGRGGDGLAVKGVPFAYLAMSGALRGLGGEFETAARGTWRQPFCGWTHRVGAAGSGVLVGVRDRIRRVGQRFRRGRNACARRALPVATFTCIRQSTASRAVPGRGGGRLGASGHDRLALFTGAGFAGRSYRVLEDVRVRRSATSGSPRTAASVSFLAAVVIVGLGVPGFGAVSASISTVSAHSWAAIASPWPTSFAFGTVQRYWGL